MSNSKFILLFCFLFSTCVLHLHASDWTTIRNGQAWTDTKGNIVQAHGAGFINVDGTWYMIGEDRSNTWRPDVNMYSSTDLQHWTFERKIIKNGVTTKELGDSRMIERPKILYCKKTQKFVVWCHYESSNYGASEVGVFECDKINGDYKYVWSGRPLGVKSRDCNVFVDNDGTAYFISTIEENQHLGLFKLSDDYRSVVNYTELFKWQSREAPAIVRHGDTYFMLFSACSGWDPNQQSYSWSKKLTSGWSERKNIGNNIAYDTQAAAILTINGTKGTTYLYVGDRWQDPDLYYSKTIIFPISFSGTNVKFDYMPSFELNQKLGQARARTDNPLISKQGWSIVDCSSEQNANGNESAEAAIDGNNNTIWHTRYSGPKGTAPHFITIDMGHEHEIAGFQATPRSDHSTNGLIRNYIFEVSTDNENWTPVSTGKWLPYWSEVAFSPITCRYLRLTSLEGEFGSLAELDVLRELPVDYTEPKLKGNWSLSSGSYTFTSTNIKISKGIGARLSVSGSPKFGSWFAFRPNGERVEGNILSINKMSEENEGIYTFIYTNHLGHSYRLQYNVSLRQRATAIDDVSEDAEVQATHYFDLAGRAVHQPIKGQVCIMRQLLADGTPKTTR